MSVPEATYKVGDRRYTIGQIAKAVQRREGHNGCGIKQNGKYVQLSKEEGLALCAQKLKKQLDKADFDTVMKRWKTVPPFEPYISDIKSILRANLST